METNEKKSYFDGGLLQQIGWGFLALIIYCCTFGICAPWAYCLVHAWETRHTVVDGRRLTFDGTGAQLFGNWIKWWALSIITIGIYSLWVSIKIKQWRTKHTHFEV